MDDRPTGPGLFREVQYFRQFWLLALVLCVAGFNLLTLVRQVFLGHPVGTNPAPDWLIILFSLLFGIGLPWLFLSANLSVEVQPRGLHYRFFPFHREWKVLPWSEVRAQRAVTYRPIREYGGWGLRYGKNGRACNVSGNRGVLFTLASGRTLLIGSDRAERLSDAVREASGIGAEDTGAGTG